MPSLILINSNLQFRKYLHARKLTATELPLTFLDRLVRRRRGDRVWTSTPHSPISSDDELVRASLRSKTDYAELYGRMKKLPLAVSREQALCSTCVARKLGRANDCRNSALRSWRLDPATCHGFAMTIAAELIIATPSCRASRPGTSQRWFCRDRSDEKSSNARHCYDHRRDAEGRRSFPDALTTKKYETDVDLRSQIDGVHCQRSSMPRF